MNRRTPPPGSGCHHGPRLVAGPGRAWIAALALTLMTATPVSADTDSAAGLPFVAAPEGSHTEWIAPQMTHDGLPMRVQRFRTSSGTDAVIDHHRRDWSRRWPGTEPMVSIEDDGWHVMSMLVENENLFISVRFRRIGTETAGYIAVSADPRAVHSNGGAERAMKTRLALPPGVRVLSRQVYLDQGRRAEQIVLEARSAPATVASRFESRLEDDGWRMVRNTRSMRPGDGYLYNYQRGSQHVFLQFRSTTDLGERTLILAIWMQ